MASDSVLGLLFEISADPSKAVAGTELFRDKTVASTEAIKAALANAQVALEQGLGQFSAETQLMAAGLTESAAKAAAAELQQKTAAVEAAEGLQQQTAATEETTAASASLDLQLKVLIATIAANGGLNTSVTEARIAAQGLAQDLGVHLPRAATSFLSRLPEFAPLLSAAFAPIAIFALIEALEQVPKIFDKIVGSITGWDEEAKKAYSDQIRLNKEYQKTLDDTLHVQHELAGLKYTDLVKADIKDKAAQAAAQEQVVVGLKAEIAAREKYAEVTSQGGGDGIEAPSSLGKQSIADLREELKKAREEADKLGLELQRLQKVQLPKEAVAQNTHEMRAALEAVAAAITKNEEAIKKQEHLRQEAEDKYANFWAARAKFIEHQKHLEEEATKTYAEAMQARIKYDAEMTKRIVDGIKERLHQEESADREVDKLVKENVQRAKQAAEEVLKLSSERESAKRQSLDRELKQETQYLNELLRLHKTNWATFYAQEGAALEKWHSQRVIALQRQLVDAKSVYGEESVQYQKLIDQKQQLDDEYTSKKLNLDNAVRISTRDATNSAIEGLSQLGGALKHAHALEVGLIVTRAAIKIHEEIAKAQDAFASGNFWAGALYIASAAEYGIVAGSQAFGGGGGGKGGGSAQSGPSGSQGPGIGTPLAAGAGGSGPNPSLHVIILGPQEAASYLAGTLNNGVRSGQVQVMATHGPSGNGL
jgi:hypothetical protein